MGNFGDSRSVDLRFSVLRLNGVSLIGVKWAAMIFAQIGTIDVGVFQKIII